MYKKSEESITQLQLFGSFLGFLLPILQLFLNLIPNEGAGATFLIREQFLLISIFAALISYILILIARNNVWFRIALNRRAHKKYQEHLAHQDANVYTLDEIQQYLKTKPYIKTPFYITPENIFTVTLPITLLSFLLFFIIGLIYQPTSEGSPEKLAVFIQAIAYILLVAFTTLTLAIYYIRDLNTKRWVQEEKSRVGNAIKLAYETNAFLELPHINLIAQSALQYGMRNQQLFLFQVGNRFYKIITDGNVNKIESIEAHDTYESMLQSLTNQVNQS